MPVGHTCTPQLHWSCFCASAVPASCQLPLCGLMLDQPAAHGHLVCGQATAAALVTHDGAQVLKLNGLAAKHGVAACTYDFPLRSLACYQLDADSLRTVESSPCH